MQVNELMIGDWVHCITDDSYHKIYRLNIGDSHLADDGLYAQYPDIINFTSDIEGIPITEEILKLNNFEMSPTHDLALLIIGDIIIEIYPSDGSSWLRIYPSPDQRILILVNHIHEIQHALRLCGLSELADNFKIENKGKQSMTNPPYAA